MILSFSIPEMLPWIIEGLPEESQCTQNGLVLPEWYTNVWKKKYLGVAESTRIKRQTIRQDSGEKSRYKSMSTGHVLHLWWKSRTSERRKIGMTPCLLKQKIVIQDIGSVLLDGRKLSKREIESLSFKDGFHDINSFYEYFIPSAPFKGYLIKW